MASPVLLVADDLSLIASVKRVLGREGYECVLATSAADAVIAFGHLLPGVMLLQPSVESGRGSVVLEELQLHPDARLLKVVLLGETVPGFAYPVEPLPIDGPHFAQTIEANTRSGDELKDWKVREVGTTAEADLIAPSTDGEPEPWRATPPSEDVITPEQRDEPAAPEALAFEAPDPQPTPPPPHQSSPSLLALTERLFGDLPSIEDQVHADVEAQVMASVESTLAQQAQQDDELQRLEDEVLAEAQRRRVSRESRILEAAALTDPIPPAATPSATLSDEESFSGLENPLASSPSTLAIPHSRAREVLARAEQMVLESRAVSEAQRRVDDADTRRERAELEALERRAEHAESLVRRERETRASLEDELERQREAQGQVGALLERERAGTAEALEGVREELAEVQARLQGRELDLEQLQREQAGLSAAVEQSDAALKGERDEALAALSAAVAQSDAALATLTSEHEQALAALARERDEALAELTRKRDEKIAELTRQREERLAELNRQQAESISALTRRHDERVTELRRELAEAHAAKEISTADAANAATLARTLDAERAAQRATVQALAEAEERRSSFEKENALVEQARTDAELARQAAEEARERAEGQAAGLQAQLQAQAAQVANASELVAEAGRQRARFEEELMRALSALQAAQANATRQEAEQAELHQELERAAQRHLGTMRELALVKDTLDGVRSRAEEAEATASLVNEKVKQLEQRESMPLSLPGRRALGLARHGSVDLEGLARLVCQLVLAQADVRLELGAAGGSRTLWFKKGQIGAAASDFEAESLIDRARRDGLIDGRQESELRMLRNATLREQLDALKGRGFIRDIEAIPLVQRCAEQIALEALSEETSQYRLTEEPPGADVMPVTVPRPTLPLLAEALRRAVPVEALLEQLGGGEAVPVATDAEWDLRALGFTDKERKMLSWVDGEATVEDVSLASGLKPEVAFRALLVARFLGVVELKPALREAPVVDAELDVHRLEAKFDEVQDADYFTILGLPKSAGGEDVHRAWERLSTEFHPLRYSGHPDAVLQQRAQVVFSLLEEAAKALEDDRRRADYARHLLD